MFSIDLRDGMVTRLFALKQGVHAELEGLAVRRTPDGALLHVLIVLDNDLPADAPDPRQLQPLRAGASRRVLVHPPAAVASCSSFWRLSAPPEGV